MAASDDARAYPHARCGGCGDERADMATLEQALLAARQLRDALEAAVRHQAGVIAGLERALAVLTARPGCALPPALRVAWAVPGEARAAGAPVAFPGADLSPREWEVLGLLAAGRSNGQIAAALFLSPRTVQRHVANAYRKIGAHNRAAATAYVLLQRAA